MEHLSLLSIGHILSVEGIRLSSGRLYRHHRAKTVAEAAFSNVSGKLIEAQEQERTRIGRELHDDIGQRLALMAIGMEQLHEDPLIVAQSPQPYG